MAIKTQGRLANMLERIIGIFEARERLPRDVRYRGTFR